MQWVHTNLKDMWPKTALIVNLEHTAQVATFLVGDTLNASNQVSARRWFVGGSDGLKQPVPENLQGLRDRHLHAARGPARWRARPGVHRRVELPLIHHTVYHTDMDNMNIVPAYGLEQSARAFLKIVDEVNKLTLAQLRINIPASTN